MQNVKWPEKDTGQTIPTQTPELRGGQERRKEPSYGYTRIGMVGWICRREKSRRTDDPDSFNSTKP
jgi:hypothetical protein